MSRDRAIIFSNLEVLADESRWRMTMETLNVDEATKQARDHAWDWFALHATQRMQAFNFFLVVAAFFVAAYGSLLEKHPVAASGIALIGAWLAVWFNRLDYRTRELLKAGETALAACEQRLFDSSQITGLRIQDTIKQPGAGASSYRRVIGVVEWTIFCVFVVAAAYAGWVWTSSPAALID
jgi:hypothetical protein